MRRSSTALVVTALATVLAGCGGGGHDAAPTTPTAATTATTSTPTSSAPTTSSVSCPTLLDEVTDLGSLPTGPGSPALALGGSSVYAVTATGAGGATEVTVVGLTGTTSQPRAVPAAGATLALGAGAAGAILLSADTKAPGLIASFVTADGRVGWQVPLPDEDATGATTYGAQVVGDTAYFGTRSGTVRAVQVSNGKDAVLPHLPAGLVPRNVLLTGGPYLTMATPAETGAAAQTIEVVDPASGDTLGSFSGSAFFTDADGDPVAIRNDLLIEATTGSSITVLGNAKGFGADVVAAAFCQKTVYALTSQAGLDLIDLGSGKTLTSTTLQGLQADKLTVAAVPSGLVVLGAPVGDDKTVDIRLIPAG